MKTFFAAVLTAFLAVTTGHAVAGAGAWTPPTIPQAYLIVCGDGTNEIVDWGHDKWGWSMDGYFVQAYERDHCGPIVNILPLRPMNLNKDEQNGRR